MFPIGDTKIHTMFSLIRSSAESTTNFVINSRPIGEIAIELSWTCKVCSNYLKFQVCKIRSLMHCTYMDYYILTFAITTSISFLTDLSL